MDKNIPTGNPVYHKMVKLAIDKNLRHFKQQKDIFEQVKARQGLNDLRKKWHQQQKRDNAMYEKERLEGYLASRTPAFRTTNKRLTDRVSELNKVLNQSGL